MAKEKEKDEEKKEKKKPPKTDLEASIKALEEVGRNEFLQMKEGKNVVRLVPWKEVFFFKAILHYGLVRFGKNTAYGCLQMFTKEEECPVCRYIEKLKDSGVPSKMKMADRLKQVTKYYMNALDRAKPEDGIKILGLTPKQMRKLREHLEDEDYGDITDPDEGRDVIITKETASGRTTYELRVRAKATSLERETWVEELHNLSKDVVNVTTHEFLKSRVTELKEFIASGKAEEEGDKEEKKKKPKKDEDDDGDEKEKKKKKKDEDDEFTEEDDDD